MPIYRQSDNCFIKYGFVDEMAFGDASNNETLYIYMNLYAYINQ